MRLVLDQLFERHEKADLLPVIDDPVALAELRVRVADSLVPAQAMRIPVGDRGDNLLLALIALRLKFDRAEASAKLEKNIAFRLEANQS